MAILSLRNGYFKAEKVVQRAEVISYDTKRTKIITNHGSHQFS